MSNKIKVLIVDDEIDVLETLQSVLESRGFEIKGVVDVLNILDNIKDFNPSVILLDVNLKNSNGGKICKYLKSSGAADKIPILLFSGDTKIKDEYQIHSADGFIEKPVKISHLVSSLNNAYLKGVEN